MVPRRLPPLRAARKGGDPVKAAQTYRRGLGAARSEALHHPAAPVWVPRWGAAEDLMSLGYLFSHAEPKDRALARAYADAALAIAPEWHYVRDILGPQIEALPPGSFEVASEVARNKEVARRFLEQAFGPQWRVARLGLAAARPLVPWRGTMPMASGPVRGSTWCWPDLRVRA